MSEDIKKFMNIMESYVVYEVDNPAEAEDAIDHFREIQEQLFDVIQELEHAIRTYTPHQYAYWQSYGLAQLKMIAGSDEYASKDDSINTLIKAVQDDEPRTDGTTY